MTNDKLLKLCTIASLTSAFILVSAKTFAWYITDSVAILSSLTDSTMDLLISFVNFVVIRYSLKPADHDHKFGHGRIEDLAALAQAVFIIAIAITIGLEAIDRIVTPVEIKYSNIGIGVMILSLVTTSFLVIFQKHVYKKTNSNVIKADSVHYITDILSNSAIIAALIVGSFYHIPYLDPIMAIIIALYIMHEAWEVGIGAFNNLMDKEFDDDLIAQIEAIIKSHPKVISYSDLRTRRAGRKEFIQFDFKTDGNITLNEAHEIAHEIEDNLVKAFPNAEFKIHQEPA